MEPKSIRLNAEIKIPSDTFKIKLGTVNKFNPKSVYFEAQTFVCPQFESKSFLENILNIQESYKDYIKESLSYSDVFSTRYIMDFSIATKGMKLNKKSILSIQCHLKQKNIDMPLSFNDIKPYGSIFVSSSTKYLEGLFSDNDFTLSKTKK